MTVEAALLGLGRTIKHKDRDYPIGLITATVRAEFERKFADRARDRLNHMQKKLTRAEYLAELRTLGEREDKGEFAFLSEAGLTTALTTPWGQQTLLQLLMPTDAPVAELLDERGDEIVWLLQRIVRDSMPLTNKASEGSHDPFAPGEAELSVISTPS